MVGDFSATPLIDFAQQAEELGFASVWAGDSLFARPRLDPLVMLAAVASATTRVSIGTAAITAALRHPLVGASMVASLDRVSHGRLVLGLGSGFPIPDTEEEFDAVGVPFRSRANRLDETVELWRCAWRSNGGGATDFQGRYWQVAGLERLPSPERPGGPPLWLAGSDTPRVIARVARHYDGWLPFLPTTEAYARAWRQIGEQASAHGRSESVITPGLYATITVDASRDRAGARLDEYVQRYYGRRLDLMATIQAYGYGTPEQCGRWMADYLRAGARQIVVRIGSLRPDRDLTRLATEVLPAMRAAASGDPAPAAAGGAL
jgi:alkanesulfonate monooxygenase SsuD/methylene tetrahydromethanopterin reductase-like flavin-dependent oxidoreductase (luciferase family)